MPRSTQRNAALIASLTAVFAALSGVWFEHARETARALRPAHGAAFEFYLLAMTVHPAFCAEHERMPECRVANAPLLVIHGLWPENREPRSYPHDCDAPPLRLDPALARELGELMPGMRQGLHEHEWREHGGCSGLDGDEYFRHVLELGRAIDAALLPKLTTFAGREASAEELRAAADARKAGLGATLTFHCRVPRGEHGRPWLDEVRQCVGKDAGNVPLAPVSCASVDRRDTGCGARFFVPDHS